MTLSLPEEFLLQTVACTCGSGSHSMAAAMSCFLGCYSPSGDDALLCVEKDLAYFQVGRAMCAEGADAKVQAQILGHFTAQLVKPGLSQRETAVAVEAVGALAPSTNRFFGEQVRTSFTPLHH